jgi:hypothetical protein
MNHIAHISSGLGVSADAYTMRPLNGKPYLRIWISQPQDLVQSPSCGGRLQQDYHEVNLPDSQVGKSEVPSPEWLAGFVAGVQTSERRSAPILDSRGGRLPDIRKGPFLHRLVSKAQQLADSLGALLQAQSSSFLILFRGGVAAPTEATPLGSVSAGRGGR